ncbi:aggregation factor core protein MAFp3, isoform C [Apostichopus japonicus]|uniref:Aggregation factor core protein MAFp3, isoform C n=1 Tax=Stichopus japonicus TaxID=307972 RepID=A0A2G8KBT3_STIJA|nr:aggregation factor core protein MAFp3, isoform C [Apostichopus japonicus]
MSEFVAVFYSSYINLLCSTFCFLALSYDDITATGGSDYANTNVHIPIPTYTGTSDQFNFLLTFTSDQIVEDHERFNVILTEVGALPAFSRTDFIVVTDVAIDQSTSVTIIDDDSATLTVVSDTACHAEDDGTATVTLTLDNQVEDEGFKFGVTYSDIDASVSTDFIGTVTLGDFATLTNLFSFTVSLVDDEVVEFEQSFSLSLAPVSIPTSFIRSEPFVYLHATSRTATVTIKDDDTGTQTFWVFVFYRFETKSLFVT